jgi:hypothetical protein
MNWIPLILSLVGGAGGGAAVGKFLKEKGLGPAANMIVGALGGAGSGALLQTLGLGGDAASAGGSGTDMMSMVTGLIGGGAGGGVLTAIVGMIKSAMGSKA